MVNDGISFRDAYQQVGNDVANGSFNYTSEMHHTHEGSIGNLCNEDIRNMMNSATKGFSTV